MHRTIRRMLSMLSPYRLPFAIGQVAMLVTAAAGLAFPWAVRTLFDHLLQGAAPRALLGAIGFLGLVLIGKEAANLVKNVALGRIGQQMIRDLRARVYHKLLQLSLDYYSRGNSGHIASSMSNDMNLLQQGLSSGLAYVIQQAISLLVVVALMFRIDALLAGIVLATVPLILLVSQRAGPRARSIAQSTQERLGALMSIVSESLSGIDVIKAFVLERVALGLFRDENDQVMTHSVQGIRVHAVASLIVGLLNALFLLLVIGLGGYRAARGYLSTPDLIAFILYAEMVAGPVSTLASLYIEVSKAVAAYRRVEHILNAENEIEQAPDALRPAPLRGRISFEGINCSYDPGVNVLTGIHLTIQPGERVALVGPSGVGKSTLVKLIPRFYDPSVGTVSIDGVNLRRFDLEYLRSQIAIVPQETHLFGLSIEDNIACGKPHASHDEVVEAARMANAHDFISSFPQGYATQVGEKGARLSGGQRQRIAIARALLKNPRILILDEATSALDAHAEGRVQEALDTLMRGRTTLIIAHRLSTIVGADRIVVLQGEGIAAIGTHAELLTASPAYRALHEAQFARQERAPLLPPMVA
jgi:subfamily B ATP-binding cassette protein MsbA